MLKCPLNGTSHKLYLKHKCLLIILMRWPPLSNDIQSISGLFTVGQWKNVTDIYRKNHNNWLSHNKPQYWQNNNVIYAFLDLEKQWNLKTWRQRHEEKNCHNKKQLLRSHNGWCSLSKKKSRNLPPSTQLWQ
jgi:hypothetical protein